ncbi:hypothetical protein LTR56_000762 [Elasticomyces elasticus]|nr:hypothetical protein LTR22_009082 [Elasticomyces elasticus]KAK3660386.1 hypothetical protein LTR56_000762 [Elasticomyces elasticus]KAK4929223.1 hypothetical protein LTR49_004120 [Elasticomyces elasticus]KAK5765779.1 hypothetical protein LTS12_004039 [Elasticomyces elasticus]
MEDAQSECGLLSLPRELRGFIWENTIDASPVDELRRKRRAVAQVCSSVLITKSLIMLTCATFQPAITRVCKQIRDETLPVFFNVTSFDLDFRGKAAMSAAKCWLLSLEQNARHIRRLCFYDRLDTEDGYTYVLYITLDPAHRDKWEGYAWDAQYELDVILDRQSIRSMGRKELLSMLFVVSEYFKDVEDIDAEYFDEDDADGGREAETKDDMCCQINFERCKTSAMGDCKRVSMRCNGRPRCCV